MLATSASKENRNTRLTAADCAPNYSYKRDAQKTRMSTTPTVKTRPSRPQSPSRIIKYDGKRPKDDHVSDSRIKLCHLLRGQGYFHELVPDRLYIAHLADKFNATDFCTKHSSNPYVSFNDVAAAPYLEYEPFNKDFGPLNLSCTHTFCTTIKLYEELRNKGCCKQCYCIVLGGTDAQSKLNFRLLAAIAAMVVYDLTDIEVIDRLKLRMEYNETISNANMYMDYLIDSQSLKFKSLETFSDVSGNTSMLHLKLDDCVRGFYAAMQNKFYDFNNFDQIEYLAYDNANTGDLNWIVPGKLLAFAGPINLERDNAWKKQQPKFYHDYFRRRNVTAIIRLNDHEYSRSEFTNYGFSHQDLIFPDGHAPDSTTAKRFIKFVDDAEGAVAVHCFAGIGRTGTLIAAYLMARYDFSPHMAIAWTRICRPGSVIGEQQDWLLTKFRVNEKRNDASQFMRNEEPISFKDLRAGNVSYSTNEKKLGQAKALILAKDQRRKTTGDQSTDTKKQVTKFTIETRSSRAKSSLNTVFDFGRTLPFMMRYSDVKDLKHGERPEYWTLDYMGNLDVKVKFPQPDYVDLRYDAERDARRFDFDESPPNDDQIVMPTYRPRVELTMQEENGHPEDKLATCMMFHVL